MHLVTEEKKRAEVLKDGLAKLNEGGGSFIV